MFLQACSVVRWVVTARLHVQEVHSRKCRHLAPEIQTDGRLQEPTRAGDVYSFGVIIGDLFVDLTDRKSPLTVPYNNSQICMAL